MLESGLLGSWSFLFMDSVWIFVIDNKNLEMLLETQDSAQFQCRKKKSNLFSNVSAANNWNETHSYLLCKKATCIGVIARHTN